MISSLMNLGSILVDRTGVDSRKLRFATWYDDNRIAFAASADREAVPVNAKANNADEDSGPADPYRGDEAPEAVLTSWYDRKQAAANDAPEGIVLPSFDQVYGLQQPVSRELGARPVEACSVDGRAVVMVAAS